MEQPRDLELLVKVLLTQSELRPRKRGFTRDDDYAEGNLAASPNYSPWGSDKTPRSRVLCIPRLQRGCYRPARCAKSRFTVIFTVQFRHTSRETLSMKAALMIAVAAVSSFAS